MRFALSILLLLATPALAQDFPALYSVTGVASNDVLNIREAPDANSSTNGALPYNEPHVEVMRLSPDGRWGRVSAEDGGGWVSMRYMAREVNQPILPYDMICTGTEPFWAIWLNDRDHIRAEWAFLDIEMRYPGLWASSPTGYRLQTYGFAAGSKSAQISGVIETETCSDGMSEWEYGFSVNLMMSDGAERHMLTGCCEMMPPG